MNPRDLQKLGLLYFGVVLGALWGATSLHAADNATGSDVEFVRENYTKFEFEIPMRDGVRLMTRVLAPKDKSTSYPILLRRTPYGLRPYSVDRLVEGEGQVPPYAREKFIYVTQDVRGRYGSGGNYMHVRPILAEKQGNQTDESTDTYDTIEWMMRHLSNHNGNVGIWGISYPGFYAAAGMIDSHPALKCASPQAPICHWFMGDDAHHHGAFYLASSFGFFSWFESPLRDKLRDEPQRFQYGTSDGYEFFLNLGSAIQADLKYFKGSVPIWNDMMEHGHYDSFWKDRNLAPRLKNVRCAVMTVGGWYDAEDLYGPLSVYKHVGTQNPGIYNGLVMGPWSHGQWASKDGSFLGEVRVHQKTALYFQEKLELPFLKKHLKGDSGVTLGNVYAFQTGVAEWRSFSQWPPQQTQGITLHLNPGGTLSWDEAQTTPPSRSWDEYVSDPLRPVPYTETVTTGMTREHMVDDQRFASKRPDVLVYTSEILGEDLTWAGPLEVDLKVSTTGTDSDWVVKLIDVYSQDAQDPDPNPRQVKMAGYQQLVRGEVFRGKYRESYEKPVPFQPGAPTRVRFTAPDIFHTFRRGHRLMVQVQSSWFPLVDRNPQTFCDIYKARPEDYQKATQRIHGESHIRGLRLK